MWRDKYRHNYLIALGLFVQLVVGISVATYSYGHHPDYGPSPIGSLSSPNPNPVAGLCSPPNPNDDMRGGVSAMHRILTL